MGSEMCIRDSVVEDASEFVNKDIVKNGAIHNLPGIFAMDGGYAVRLRKL